MNENPFDECQYIDNDDNIFQSNENTMKSKHSYTSSAMSPPISTKISDGVPWKETVLRHINIKATSTLNAMKAMAKEARTSIDKRKKNSATPAFVFGKSICELDNNCFINLIPIPVVSCIEYLTECCLDLVGIFRIPGSTSEIKSIKQMFDSGENVNFGDIEIMKTPHTAAGLLKLYFRELPEPLLTFELYDCFIASNGINMVEAKIDCIRKIIAMVPTVNVAILIYLLKFLITVEQHSDINKMNTSNLAMVFAPNLLRPKDQSMQDVIIDTPAASQVMEFMIINFNEIFSDSEKIVQEEIQKAANNPSIRSSKTSGLDSLSFKNSHHSINEEVVAVSSNKRDDQLAKPEEVSSRKNKIVQNMSRQFQKMNTRIKDKLAVASETIPKIKRESISNSLITSNNEISDSFLESQPSDNYLKKSVAGPRKNPFEPPYC